MVYLPMVGSITSLNASVAAAVLMYEVLQSKKPKKISQFLINWHFLMSFFTLLYYNETQVI